MQLRIKLAAGILLTPMLASLAMAAEPTRADLDSRFHAKIQPFIQAYCLSCHSGDQPTGDFDLSTYKTLDGIVKDTTHWARVLEKVKAGEMPPPDAKDHPTAQARQDMVAWVTEMRRFEALQNAGDPGIVLARRLSSAEYNYTIRDLTGVDIQPAKEFPVDPANQAGFDTSGESLTMSSSLLKKYMEAARLISEHLVLRPEGLAFAPFSVVADTDRDKFCVNRIIQFYQRQPVDLAGYFLAAWQFENRAALGRPQATLDDFAAGQKVSPKYLALVWSTLSENKEDMGPIAGLQSMWRKLPVPDAKGQDAALRGCVQMRQLVYTLRESVRPNFDNLSSRTMHAGSQPLVLWKDRQYAATRLTYEAGAALQLQAADVAPGGPALAVPTDPNAVVKYEDAFKRFCAIFPDVFFISERARMYLDPTAEAKLTGRFLSAGFHSQSGYFRDDVPLYQLVLSPEDQHELDGLWQDLDFVANAAYKQYTGMMWFERTDSSFMRAPEFDFARPEDMDCTSEEKITKLKQAWLVKAKANGATNVVLDAISYHFDDVNKTMRWVEQARLDAEPKHVAALEDFAQRAYRRPLTKPERDGIAAFYQSLRTEDHLDHENAVRDTLVSILMSPYFCYRTNAAPPTQAIQPLTDYELASRLSYFLWSSMPDDQLLARAAAGDLHQPSVLAAETQRMIQDDRVRGLATEFGGNWLDFRRFEEINSVDRGRFPNFTNDLREAMFEEPIRFFVDLARRNGSVIDFLSGDYTFVNPVLARHYGMPNLNVTPDTWVRVDNAHQYDRGGLLPMAVFETKNAPGLRTSPVKRGYWVVKRLLGEEIPPPPPNVPALPPDESKLGELSLPQMLAQHRQDKNCAVCHDHFDAIGLAFEGFGPVGERRDLDLGGKPVENHVTFRDGVDGTGMDGLRAYLLRSRQSDFVDNLCRKLLAKALDRTLTLSDDLLIEQMRAKLQTDNYQFDALVNSIVTSPQFLNKRGQGTLARKEN